MHFVMLIFRATSAEHQSLYSGGLRSLTIDCDWYWIELACIIIMIALLHLVKMIATSCAIDSLFVLSELRDSWKLDLTLDFARIGTLANLQIVLRI